MTEIWPAIGVKEIELTEADLTLDNAELFHSLYVLIRYQERSLGWIFLAHTASLLKIDALTIRQTIDAQLGWNLVPLLLQSEKLDRKANFEGARLSIIVFAYTTQHDLSRCLTALANQTYREFEIVVISTLSTRHQAELTPPASSIRFISVSSMQATSLRNLGIQEARNPIIAFLDARSCPDRAWAKSMVQSFAKPDVMAVTGLVLPGVLETKSQIQFEFDYPGWHPTFTRRLIHRNALTSKRTKQKTDAYLKWLWRGTLTDAELLWANQFGSGLNMAFRREIFDQVGVFETGLQDAYTDTNSCDYEIMHRIVMSGHSLIYEPNALIWHTFPKDDDALKQLIYHRAYAFISYLRFCCRNRTLRRRAFLKFMIFEWCQQRLIGQLLRHKNWPRHLVFAEVQATLKSLWQHRNLPKRSRRVFVVSQQISQV
ncbi:MAG: glycosyltransferase [Chloroflexota bacterium]